MNSTQSFTIIDVVMAIFKSPIKFILWFLVFFSLFVLAYLVVPREYASDGKLFVQVGRSSVGAGPTTSAGKVSLQDSRETEVKSVVDLLGSRELAGKVVDNVGVERILKPNSAIGRFINGLPSIQLGGATVDQSETDLTSDEIKGLNRRNKAITRLMKGIDVQHEKNTTVVSVGIKAQSPFLAQDVVQNYLDEYQKTHVKVNTPQSGGFFDSQLKLRKKELLEAEQKLEVFRSSLNVLDVGSARNLLQREINQLRLDALTTAVKLSESQEKSLKMKKSFSKIPEFIVGGNTTTSSLARDRAREALYNLQIQESDLASKYNSSNPKLTAIRNSIKKAKSQYNRIPQTFKEAQKSPNPAHKEILVMLTKASADAEGFQKRLQATEALIAMKVAEVDRLNKLVVQENAMVRNVEIMQKTMMGIAEKTAESVTNDALDSERISNVKVAQSACLVPKKVFPSGTMFGVLGAAVSALMATVMTFLKDFKIGYEMDRQNRQRRLDQGYYPPESVGQTQTRPRRLVREPALARTGAVREDFQPADSPAGFSNEGRYAEDEEYAQGEYRAQPPLHQELQREEAYQPNHSQVSSAARSRIETWRRRAESQVSIFSLVGVFSILIAAYLFLFVF